MESSQNVQTVIPYFMVRNAAQFMEFARNAFDAEPGTVRKQEGTEGIVHAEMRIGSSTIYFADTSHDGSCGPGVCGELDTDGLVPIQMYVHVENAAETYKKAIAAGAASLMEAAEGTGQMAGIADPFGNLWWIKSLE